MSDFAANLIARAARLAEDLALGHDCTSTGIREGCPACEEEAQDGMFEDDHGPDMGPEEHAPGCAGDCGGACGNPEAYDLDIGRM